MQVNMLGARIFGEGQVCRTTCTLSRAKHGSLSGRRGQSWSQQEEVPQFCFFTTLSPFCALPSIVQGSGINGGTVLVLYGIVVSMLNLVEISGVPQPACPETRTSHCLTRT